MTVLTPNPAHAQGGDPYLVKGITVDVSAGSAIEARKKAFTEARRKAYEQMASQILDPADRPNLVVPDDRIIASLVRDLEIKSEKMTSRRYVGTVDVRFTPAAVKRTLHVSNVPQGAADPSAIVTTTTTTGTTALPTAGMGEEYIYSPTQGGPVRTTTPAHNIAKPAAATGRAILVLPWYGPMGRQTLWGQGNPWRAAWEENAALSRDKSAPILLPVGDVDDLRDYSPPQPMSRRGDIDNLLKRYKASEAVLAMAEPNNDGGAIVSLYRYDNGAPVPVGRFAVDATVRDVMGEAVQKSAAALRSLPAPASAQATTPLPVSVTSPGMISPVPVIASPPAGGTYHTLARFSGLQEWVAMRAALTRVPGLGLVGIRSISPSQATIEFNYTGDYANLARSMTQSGLQLAPLPAGTVTPGGATPQFLLSMPRGY